MNHITRRLLVFCLSSLLTNGAFAADPAPFTIPAQTSPQATKSVAENYGKLPLSFEPNQGQTDPQVKFLSRGNGYSLFLTPTEAVLTLQKPAPAKHGKTGLHKSASPASVLTMKLVGCNASAKIAGGDQQAGKSNYFIGNDPSKWRTNISNYSQVNYKDVYPGIDLVYYGNQRQLEFDLVVQPGTDPKAIRLDFRGKLNGKHAALRVNDKGDLIAGTKGSEVVFHKPVIYQPTATYETRGPHQGVEGLIDGKFVLTGTHQVRFQIAAYDKSKPLVIDPTLVYSTYLGGHLGGNHDDSGTGIAVDASGNAYVTGTTLSSTFPVTPAAFQTTFGGSGLYGFGDAFVSKLNAAGSALLYSTYLGGAGSDLANGIVIDVSGNAYVTGFTTSANFPTTPGAFQTTFDSGIGPFGAGNAFVSKLNAAGSALLYSTYLGDQGTDALGIAVDASGNAYVTGVAGLHFPTTPGAFQPTSVTSPTNPAADAFVSKLNPDGTALVYSTYLGGFFGSIGAAITVDTSTNAYVTGFATSDFPITPGAFQTKFGGPGDDAFVSKLNAAGSALLYSTFLGGSSDDAGQGIAVDAFGSAYVTGFTTSSTFPVTAGAFQTVCKSCGPPSGLPPGLSDAFITKLNPDGSALLYSTYLGGTGEDSGNGIALDASGNAFVTGSTVSSDFPTTPGTFLNASGGGFVSKLNADGSALLYSTYFGSGRGIAVDASGNAYVTGTAGRTFPTTPGAFQTTSAGSSTFVAKISDSPDITSADLAVGNVSTSHTAVPGGLVTYAITLNNFGPDDAKTVKVVNVFPEQTTFVSCHTDAGGICGDAIPPSETTNSSSSVVISFPTLAKNHSAFITVVAQVEEFYSSGTILYDTAAIASITPDPNPSNNSSTSNVVVRYTSDLSIQDAVAVSPGSGQVHYLISVTAPSPAHGVTVTDPLPPGTTFVSAIPSQGTCTTPAVGANGTVACTLGGVPAGTSPTVFITVKAASGTTVTNTATVNALTFDPNHANNSSTIATTVP